MLQGVRLLRVGEGVPFDGGSGRVVAVFPRAVYVSVPGELFALVGRDVEPGPLHAHMTGLPEVSVGDPVRVCGGRLSISGRPVPGRPDVWRAPPLPGPGRVGAIAWTLRHVLDHEPDLNLGMAAAPIPDDLASAAAALAGRGAGLTPAGDDVLAGLLLVARMRAGPSAETRLVALARRCRTHDISRAFLVEAARGRSVAALHDLLTAGAAGNIALARQARDRLARLGHTSGLDLAYGVLAGAAATSRWKIRVAPTTQIFQLDAPSARRPGRGPTQRSEMRP
jgi:hypothetical protein